MLVTALVATSLTTVMLWREVDPLRKEVRRLRRAGGVLTISDPKRVHAVGVETHVTKAWKWRVWVPAGRRVAVHVAVSDIPDLHVAGSVPAVKSSGRLELHRQNTDAAQVDVTLAAEKLLDGTVRWNLKEGNVSTHIPVPPKATEWLVGQSSGYSGGGRAGYQVNENPGDPLLLLHQRQYYKSGQVPPLGDGVVVWIEEAE